MKRFDTAPLQEYSAEEIKGIRNRLNMTQAVFALFMGVSKKTVEAWESGQNIPNGPSLRLLWMAEQDPGFPERYGIVKVESMTSGEEGDFLPLLFFTCKLPIGNIK